MCGLAGPNPNPPPPKRAGFGSIPPPAPAQRPPPPAPRFTVTLARSFPDPPSLRWLRFWGDVSYGAAWLAKGLNRLQPRRPTLSLRLSDSGRHPVVRCGYVMQAPGGRHAIRSPPPPPCSLCDLDTPAAPHARTPPPTHARSPASC